MNYQRHYDLLISKAKNRIITGYTETKKNMSYAKKDYIPWNKGIKTGSAYSTSSSWKTGNIPWNKGKEHPCKEDTKLKIKEANSGRKRVYKEDGTWIMIKTGDIL